MGKEKIKWLDLPEEHDYPAAQSYLSLVFDEDIASEIVSELMEAEVSYFKAKDIFRASRLPILNSNNAHVRKNIEKIEKEKELSPILLVRDTINRVVIIADGYHRTNSVYFMDEDAIIPCKIVSFK